MKTAYGYARVSSKDQEMQGNSIPEQLDRIYDFAAKKDIQIIKTYQDALTAYHEDENRENFDQMIADALKERPNYIIVDDSSRFARLRDVAITTKKILRKHAMDLLYASEENVNPRTVAGLWIESIRETKNEASSMETAFNTIRGMTGNIKNRDPKTGWCYKNGGRTPYGYVDTHLTVGTNSRHKPIIKTIWELHPDNHITVHMIIVELYTRQEMSYEKIRDYLNEKNIPGPTGNAWGTSTLVEMLRDNRLEQYAGTGFWNKENHQTKGTRFNPREEWIQVDNAHPAIITEEELQLALMRKANSRKNAPAGRTNGSPYLFTGKNLEGQPMFFCSSCHGNVIGYSSSSGQWRKYICGPSRYKGKAGCPDGFMIDQDWLESSVLEEIEKRYALPDRIDDIIKEVKEDIRSGFKDYNHALNDLNKEKNSLDSQRQRLLDAIKHGINPAAISNEINNVQEQIDQLDVKLGYLKNNPPTQLSFDETEIRRFFASFKTAFNEATAEERKKLIRTFVRHLELDPKNKEVRVAFYPDKVVHSIGAGNRT